MIVMIKQWRNKKGNDCVMGPGPTGDCFVPTIANGWVEYEEKDNVVGVRFVGKFRYEKIISLVVTTMVQVQ